MKIKHFISLLISSFLCLSILFLTIKINKTPQAKLVKMLRSIRLSSDNAKHYYTNNYINEVRQIMVVQDKKFIKMSDQDLFNQVFNSIVLNIYGYPVTKKISETIVLEFYTPNKQKSVVKIKCIENDSKLIFDSISNLKSIL